MSLGLSLVGARKQRLLEMLTFLVALEAASTIPWTLDIICLVIFRDMMTKVGLADLASLDTCSQVLEWKL